MPIGFSSPQPLSHLSATAREPLAVIGIGCRLPGDINSPTTFWEALLEGRDAICDVPEDRWNHSRFHDTNPEKFGCIRNAKGGFIKGVDLFDGEFFGYFPAEAQRIDPQQRLLLEVTHEAMEDAGIRRDQLDGSRTSVFIGSFMYDYLCMQTGSDQRDEINSYVAMGSGIMSLANRVSYDFNLKGPSVSLDTACSSSLVAVHLACRSLWNGEAELAIAGGVNMMLRPESSIVLSRAGFLNPDEKCKAFDASANGYVRGEGVGAVILKPLSKALIDGDLIYACVLATGVNQDGYLPEGFTVPNVFSQIALLESVYVEAGIDPLKVDYVEAHGTGTSVGDPIESLAIGAVLGQNRPAGPPLLMGSVKTNIGHLEGAAGIAGFIKGVLTAYHRIAPPNLHFHEPNPGINWDYNNLDVPTIPTSLNSKDRPLNVGVNSFGAGGTNAHVVIQGPAIPKVIHHIGNATHRTAAIGATLYVLSSPNRDTLRTIALRHADFLNTASRDLDDIAFSAFSRRSHYPLLLAVVGETKFEVADQLRKFADGQVDSTILSTKITRRKKPKLALVFSGQGGQWARMGLQLMEREPIFRESIEEIDSLFHDLAGWSLLEELRKSAAESKVNDTVVVQPAIMAIQIALVRLYERYGIRPAGVVGHSIGEVAAAFTAGAITLEQAVQVIYHRSQAQNLASGKGGMLAVGLSFEDATKLIEGYDGRVSIGAVNGPEMLTLSGDTAPLDEIAKVLESRSVFNRTVKVQVAYHSHHMEPINGIMLESLKDFHGEWTRIPLYSTVSGRLEHGTHLDAEYWFQNARKPVLFTKALAAMLTDEFDTFVEIGPHPVLVGGSEALIQKRETDAAICASMTRKEPEVTVFLQSLARLAARGLYPDTTTLFGSERRYVRLPAYPWQHTRHWFESPAAADVRFGRFEHPFLKSHTQMGTEEGLAVWEASLDVQKFPYLYDHQVDGEIVFPATGHLELAWAASSQQFRYVPFFLENLQFDSPLIIPDNSRYPLNVHLEIVSADGDYRICTRPAESREHASWSKHSSGRINTVQDRFEKSLVSLDDLRVRFRDEECLSIEQFYGNLREAGLAYGETFRCVQELRHLGQEWLAQLTLPVELLHESKRNYFHPALLDACIHVVFAEVHRNGDPFRIYLPYRINRVRLYGRPTQHVWSHVHITRHDDQYLCSDTLIFDETGALVAEVLGLIGKRLVGAGSRQADMSYEDCYEYQWTEATRVFTAETRVYDLIRAVLIAPELPDSAEDRATSNIARLLSAEGVQTRIVRPGPEECYDELLADTPLDRRTLIVFAAGLSPVGSDWKGLSGCPAIPSLLRLVQTLHRREGVPRLCLITNGATGINTDPSLDLSQAVLHGMARVIRSEFPQMSLTVIDLSAAMPADEISALIEELLHTRRDQDESEIAMRGDVRLLRRMLPVDRDSAELAATVEEPGVGGAYRADQAIPGSLEQIAFRRLPPVVHGADDVEIAVQASSLNFKDVMNAMGLLPSSVVAGGLTEHRLGLEVAGRVLRTGPLVKHIQPGDDVIARVAEGFCGRVVANGKYVFPRPKQLTAQQAAAIPLVYVTAWYSLFHLARIIRGETVLIHSAAGGVGFAAIQLARRAGATVIATAGSEEKREWLRQLGIEHVFDSRTLDFYNKVIDVTGGRGVDIVLNSLTGRFIAQGMKCLAPFGRFIELGKVDIYRNSKLGLERLGENISYFVVDVDRLAVHKPELHRQILSEVIDLFASGDLQPHEITEFQISDLPLALKFMIRASYRGKIVLNMEQDTVPTLPARNASFRSDRSYLISAGASGFGLEIAQWMLNCGARCFVLLSRSGPKSDEDRKTIELMRERGARILLPQVDVADQNAVRQVMEQIRGELPPLAGVIHGAAVMDDATIPNIDMARFERVFRPKAQGAWSLHEATVDAGFCLDFFVMLSSVSSALGLYGQVNYAAANYFLDALAQYRQLKGLPGTSINLGILGQYAGLSKTLNEGQDVIGLVESQGLLVTPLSHILAKLDATIVQQPVQRMTGRFDWIKFRAAYPHLARDSRFVDLLSDAALARGSRSKRASLRDTLSELDSEQQIQRLQEELAGALARILDVLPEKLDVTASIDSFGLDSLALTSLQIGIVRSLDINVPLIKLLKGPSIATLAIDLAVQLTESAAGESVGDAAETGAAFTLADLEGVHVLSPWLIRGSSSASASIRLICFHSMGVGASLFTKFLLNPPDDFDILAVQTPGRENRLAEPAAESVMELVDEIAPMLHPLFDRPVIIWGHSFGGVVAWEVIRRLRDEFQLEPKHFVVTGTAAPHLMDRWQNREVLLKSLITDNSPEYLMSLSRYVENPDFIKAILPGMRRDFPLLKNYQFRPGPPLSCPMTAFAARQDDMVYADEIREWSQHTGGGFELIDVDGDHWFLDRNRERIMAMFHELAACHRPAQIDDVAESRSL